MIRRLVPFTVCAALAATPRLASANGCNLYQAQRWGEIREGCSLTVFALPEVDPALPEITRGGEPVVPAVEQDQLTLKVLIEQYPTPDSCTLQSSYENRTFDRYVVTWHDLHAGDEIVVDGVPMTVPAAGDCGVVDPFFYCQDGIQYCDDAGGPGEDEESSSGCSAGSSTCGWLGLPFVAFVVTRRRSRR
jgi:hypothetical protein